LILIADSGSTKTDWRLLVNKEVSHSFKTQGFNPFFIGSEDIKAELEVELLPNLSEKTDIGSITNIFFYGAGCSSIANKEIVSKALNRVFTNAHIEIEHDLLGATRSVCGKQEGVSAILGTGSNSCFYDGKQIVDNIPSLGYMLGDEGSGSHIGKALIRGVMYQEAPVGIKDKFYDHYAITEKELIAKIYNTDLPNRYLAKFSQFVGDNLSEPYLQNIVLQSFDAFFRAHITKYKDFANKKLNCVGSVGYYYKELLTEVADFYKMEVGTVISAPMDGLAEFHLEELK
jgi:N-acetylglucosamine kinase-like BadF-type ATPase